MFHLFFNRVLSYKKFCKYINKNSIQCDDLDTLKIFNNVKKELGIHKNINFYKNDISLTPMLIGFFNQRIIIPNSQFKNIDLYNIFKHELIHYKRGDIFYKWAFMFANAIHWFNPIIYFINKDIFYYCELSCDELIIKNLTFEDRKKYGNTLLTSLEFNNKINNNSIHLMLSKDAKTIKDRLKSIKNFSKTNKIINMFLILFVFLLGFVASYTLNNHKSKNIEEPFVLQNTNENQKNSSIGDDKNIVKKIYHNNELILSDIGHSGIFPKWLNPDKYTFLSSVEILNGSIKVYKFNCLEESLIDLNLELENISGKVKIVLVDQNNSIYNIFELNDQKKVDENFKVTLSEGINYIKIIGLDYSGELRLMFLEKV